MKKSKAETADTRKRIVEIAARSIRANGIHATGLADVMSEAGLSHGGFYRHFESKDHLVAEACASGLATIIDSLEAVASANEGKDGFKAVVDAYMSIAHRDAPADGCPFAGMGSELVRADERTRAEASRGFARLVDLLSKRIGRRQPEAARSDAVFALSAMVGAITIARIVDDPDVSTSILQDVKQHLHAC